MAMHSIFQCDALLIIATTIFTSFSYRLIHGIKRRKKPIGLISIGLTEIDKIVSRGQIR